MIYDTLSKGEDGLYHSRALNDEKKRYFIQLNEVTVSDVDQETGEVSFEVSGDDNQAKVEAVHVTLIFNPHWKIVKSGLVKTSPKRQFQVHTPEVKISKLIAFLRHVFLITRRNQLNLIQ